MDMDQSLLNLETTVKPSYSVKIDPDVHALIAKIAKQEIRTISGVIKISVLTYAAQHVAGEHRKRRPKS